MDNGSTRGISEYPESVRESLVMAIDLQQNFYELSSDWNYYEASEHEYLKRNIRYSICGAPEADDDGDSSQDKPETKSKLDPKQVDRERIVDLVYSQILEASRSTSSLYVGTIFNVLCNIDKKNKKFVSPVPIFKVKRCLEKTARSTFLEKNSTTKKKIGTTALYPCCVYYIDSEGRIYKNWTDYVTNNTLPKALMVLPMGGFYQADPSASSTAEDTSVWLEIGPTPAVKQILPYLDVASTALGLGALGVGVAALAAPIAAPIALAGTVAGAVSGAYGTARSTQQLVDRHGHQQSISVTDRTARSAWFGVAGGLAGGIASGSTYLLNRAVRTGMTVGNVGRTTYNAIGIGNIVINGMGIGNGMYSIYQNYHERKEFSYLEITQVMAHVLFFGNAVMNFQTAKTIITNTQQQILQDYDQSLRSNRHRKAFRRIRRNTEASSSDSMTADSEIIRGIRSIENRDDFFASVVRNRKIFNANNAEVTFKDGYAMINDNVRFDPVQLSQQPTHVRVNTVSAAEPLIKISKSALPTPAKMLQSTYMEKLSTFKEIVQPVVALGPTVKPVVEGVTFIGGLILDMQGFTKEDFKNLVAELAKLALKVVQEHRIFITDSFEAIMHYLWYTYVRPRVDSHLQEMGIDVSNIVQFSGSSKFVYDIIQAVINQIYDGLEKFLEEIIEGLSKRPTIPQPTEAVTCNICSGYVLTV